MTIQANKTDSSSNFTFPTSSATWDASDNPATTAHFATYTDLGVDKKYGNYYNRKVASANTLQPSTLYSDYPESICPLGWRIPSAPASIADNPEDSNTEYHDQLGQIYDYSAFITYSASSYPLNKSFDNLFATYGLIQQGHVENDVYYTKIANFPMSFVFNGYHSNSLQGVENFFYMHISTVGSELTQYTWTAKRAYNIRIVISQKAFSTHDQWGTNVAFPIRCVSR